MSRNDLTTSSNLNRQVVPLMTRRVRATISDPSYDWWSQAAQKLNQFVSLEKGWDGYNGKPISYLTANFVSRLLENLCSPDDPAPQLVPCSDGSCQIEWHMNGIDVEILVKGPFEVYAWKDSSGSQDCAEEIPLTNDFSPILPWIKELRETTNVVSATA